MTRKRIDIANQKFGHLTAINPEYITINGRSRTYWNCVCECGAFHKVEHGQLKKGGTTSCGCRTKTMIGEKLKKGGYRANFVVAFHGIKSSAKQRNYIFDIQIDTFHELSQKECFYCGDIRTNCCKERTTCEPFFYNGLDRVNNNIGYTITNVVPCCKFCNWAKSTMTQKEFLNHIKKIADKHKL